MKIHIYRFEHECTSAIYYSTGVQFIASQYNAMHSISFDQEPTVLEVGETFLLSN